VGTNIQKPIDKLHKKRPEQAFWRKDFSFDARSGRNFLLLKTRY